MMSHITGPGKGGKITIENQRINGASSEDLGIAMSSLETSRRISVRLTNPWFRVQIVHPVFRRRVYQTSSNERLIQNTWMSAIVLNFAEVPFRK